MFAVALSIHIGPAGCVQSAADIYDTPGMRPSRYAEFRGACRSRQHLRAWIAVQSWLAQLLQPGSQLQVHEHQRHSQ